MEGIKGPSSAHPLFVCMQGSGASEAHSFYQTHGQSLRALPARSNARACNPQKSAVRQANPAQTAQPMHLQEPQLKGPFLPGPKLVHQALYERDVSMLKRIRSDLLQERKSESVGQIRHSGYFGIQTRAFHPRSWQVLSRGPSGDRIARSCRHMGPDLTVRIGVKDRIAKLLLSQYVLGFWALSNCDCMP